MRFKSFIKIARNFIKRINTLIIIKIVNSKKKLFIKFINIKVSYRNYNISFKLKSKLYKYLK